MEVRAGQVRVHYVEHGTGRPVLVLHGAGVDHREAEACFEPVLCDRPGLRRIYPDLPGMGHTPAPETLRSADDVLDTLLGFAEQVAGGTPPLLIGHSAGGYFAQAMAARRPGQVAGLALVCPLLPTVAAVPPHRVVAGPGDLGDDEFRGYFVVQTPEMLDRYERYVAPAQRSSTRRRSSGSASAGSSPPMRRRPIRARPWSWRGGWTPPSDTPPPSRCSTTTPTPLSPWSTTRGTLSPTSNPTSCGPCSPTGSSGSSGARGVRGSGARGERGSGARGERGSGPRGERGSGARGERGVELAVAITRSQGPWCNGTPRSGPMYG